MKYVVLSVRDRKADTYGRPVFAASIGQAVRSFADEVNRGVDENVMFHHPEDFDLFHLGDFDDASGLFACGPPAQVSLGIQVTTKVRKNGVDV